MALSDQELNVKIAEALGKHWHKPTEEEVKSGSYYQYEPNYCRDLNLMHEAEKSLQGSKDDEHSEVGNYSEELCAVLYGNAEITEIWYIDLIHATARQRAEAFARVKGIL